MPRSVLEAIKMGIWDFEPRSGLQSVRRRRRHAGHEGKAVCVAERVELGLPLWHVNDRDDVEAPPPTARSRAHRRRKPR